MKRAWTALLAVALLCTGCAHSVSEQPEVRAVDGAPQTMPDTAAPESAFQPLHGRPKIRPKPSRR